MKDWQLCGAVFKTFNILMVVRTIFDDNFSSCKTFLSTFNILEINQ